MKAIAIKTDFALKEYLSDFSLDLQADLFEEIENKTVVESVKICGKSYPKFVNEYWTSKQRQSSSLHEISYRGCFKAQLPKFFIELLTNENDIVYDPFAGRGTTMIEAALLGRQVVANDVSPLTEILCKPRLEIPKVEEIKDRLNQIEFDEDSKSNVDLSMFFHQETLKEIVSLKNFLKKRKENNKEDYIDSWIRMVATNRLTGHSSGFFSVYTLPPNQAVLPKRQVKINEKRNQIPSYRNVKKLIVKKSKSLLRDITINQIQQLKKISKGSLFLTEDAGKTKQIPNELIKLTVTSPPFLDVVQYKDDNWLRCWFNSIDAQKVKITMAKTIEKWCDVMADVFQELYRITEKKGFVCFEVGEVKNGKIKLDEYVVPLGENAGFTCEGIVINEQVFTKTSNIWGVKNNNKGTNTNRIVIFSK